MNKPISMIINETSEKIVQACNESELPVSILELIIKNIYNEVQMLAEKTFKNDKSIYTNNLLNEMKVNETDSLMDEKIDE